jgi:hypothetical protein
MFLWGYLKARVKTTLSANLDALHKRIIEEIDIFLQVSRQKRLMIQCAVAGMLKSIQLCIERNGGHVENQVGNFSM